MTQQSTPPPDGLREREGMSDPFNPSPALLAKLGSAIVHAEEMLFPTGHIFDKAALESVVADPEVQGWLDEMRKMAMVPVKR